MKHETLRLLIIDTSTDAAELLLNVLRKGGHAVRPHYINEREMFEQAIDEHTWDMILSIPQCGSLLVTDVLDMLEHKQRDIPTIVIYDDENGLNDYRVQVMRAGACDGVSRTTPDHLLLVVERELENKKVRRARRRAEHALHESQKRYKSLFGDSKEAVAFIMEGMHIHANQAYLDEFGYPDTEELESITLLDLVAPAKQAEFKTFMRDLMKSGQFPAEIELTGNSVDNEEFELKMSFTEATYDGEECLQLVIKSEDVSSEYIQKLDLISKQDQTTGTFNRTHFLDRLDDAVAKALAEEKRAALLYIQLDTYSAAKDAAGPAGADDLMRDIVGLIRKNTSSTAVIGRYGDDIFTVILPMGLKDAEKIAEAICGSVKNHITETAGQSIATTASIGITRISDSVDGVDEVLASADNARRLAHGNGGNQCHVFDPAKDIAEEVTIEGDAAAEIRAAIADRRLSLVFQPIVSLHGDSAEIYETFLRMTDRDGEIITGKALFEAAETANLVVELDKWVIHHALEIIKAEHQAGKQTNIFIKLSDAAIRDEKTLIFLGQILKMSGIDGQHLTIEISETTAVSQVKAAKAYTTALKQMGCKSALEHFGSGLNSLNILNHLDVDYLKIDASLIAEIAEDEECRQQVQAIQAKANELGKITIAASVEDTPTLAVLWQCGIHCAQGNAIQEPASHLAYDFTDDEEEDASASMF